jgi:hypothetical protein
MRRLNVSHDERTSPLPPDADGPEDIIQAQPPDRDAALRDEEASPLPPDPGSREDIMSADPREQAGPPR